MSQHTLKNSRSSYKLAGLSYVQELVAYRRVLFIGDDAVSAKFIMDSRARRVCAVSESIKEPDDQIPGLEFETMAATDLRFRDGSFDVAVVPQLSLIDNPAKALEEIRRVVGPGGQVMVSVPNPVCANRISPLPSGQTNLDYYEVYDLLAGFFKSVQMIGQSPFVGYAIADLAFEDDDLPISFDTKLVDNESEDIEWFIAICGEYPADISPYSVVQIPLEEIVGGPQKTEDSTVSEAGLAKLQEELSTTKIELGNRGVKIESLEKELEVELQQSEAARARAVELSKELENERRANTKQNIETQYSKRSSQFETNDRSRELNSQLRQAQACARAAEESRDELVDRLREDAAELNRLREKFEKQDQNRAVLVKLEQANLKLKRDLEQARGEVQKIKDAEAVVDPELKSQMQKALADLRQAEQRAQSAEASRDELVDHMRADASEIERLRNKIESAGSKADEQDQLKVQLKQLEDELVKAKQEGEKSVEAQKPMAKIMADLRQAERRAHAAEESRDELVDRMRADASEIDRLSGKSDELKEKSIADREQLKKLQEELELAKQAKPEPEKQPEPESEKQPEPEPESTIETSGEEIELLTEENKQLESKLALQGKSLREVGGENKRLEALVRDLLAQLESVTSAKQVPSQNDDCDQKIDVMEAEVAALRGAKAGQHRARVEAELSLAAAEGENKKLKIRLANMQIQQEQNGQIQDKVTQRDGKIAQLESELQACKWRTDELEARNQELERGQEKADTDESLAPELEAVHRNARMLEAELDSQKQKAQSLESDIASARQRISSLEGDIQTNGKRRATLENELADIGDRYKKLEQLSNQSRQHEEAKMELEQRLQMVTTELRGANDRISALNLATKEATTTAYQEMAEDLRESKKCSDMAIEQNEILSRQLNDELDRNRQLDEVVKSLREKLGNESDRTYQAGADAARIAGERGDLESKLTQSESKLLEQTKTSKINETTLLSMRQEFASLWDEQKRLRISCLKQRQLNDALENQLAHCGQEKDSDEIKKLKAELSSMDRTLVDLRTESDEKEKALLDSRKKNLEANNEALDSAQGEIQQLQEELTELQANADIAQEKVVVASQASADVSEELAEAISLCERLKEELEQAKKELEQTRKKEDLIASVTGQLEER